MTYCAVVWYLTHSATVLINIPAKFFRNIGFWLLLSWHIAWNQSHLAVVAGYFYLWYELNLGQCTNIMSRGRGHMLYGSLPWMLLVWRNKGTECNEMRNFLLNVVTRVETQGTNSVDDYGDHFARPTARCFFCDIHWNLTDSTAIKILKSDQQSSDQYRS